MQERIESMQKSKRARNELLAKRKALAQAVKEKESEDKQILDKLNEERMAMLRKSRARMRLEKVFYLNIEPKKKYERMEERLYDEMEKSQRNLEVLKELKEKELKLIAALENYKKTSRELEQTKDIPYFYVDDE
eukprot:TRINITY_DN10269_c0_g14_i1.p1 TRINITY_DN10269_c0_g14~~TRINITY_DN10269_c0_g14_i1.p1  ORF type:complete len:134 (-),score=63.62 TRINITY_DN10269_c0_g14_i1:37-438(-)